MMCFRCRGAPRRAIQALLLVAAIPAGCTANQGTPSWPRDCVGRMEIQIPGESDLAAYTFKNLRSQLDAKQPGVEQAEFPDGEVGGYSARSWYDGSVYVSHSLTKAQLDTLREDATRIRTEIDNRAKRDSGIQRPAVHAPASSSPTNAERVVWGTKGYGALLRLDEHALLWRSAGDLESSAEAFQAVIGRLRMRALSSVPLTSGICLPYAFVADEGRADRDVRMTYRLKVNPDIQIMLKDATAAVHEPGIRTRNNEPEPATVSFWSQLLTQSKEVKPLWTPTTRPVKLAGYTGLASFVQLTREDSTIDHGYLAIVRGDPKAKEDTPDLMLYIVQDSKQAKAKGKEPMTKDAFITMAERVAASVRRRAVSGR
jgi:Tle cognate immunity protein 4 C-terminal domain